MFERKQTLEMERLSGAYWENGLTESAEANAMDVENGPADWEMETRQALEAMENIAVEQGYAFSSSRLKSCWLILVSSLIGLVETTTTTAANSSSSSTKPTPSSKPPPNTSAKVPSPQPTPTTPSSSASSPTSLCTSK